jgi:GT2 family glycosyltransferase
LALIEDGGAVDVSTAGPAATPRVVVVVASLGRPKELSSLLTHLETQSIKPSRVILSVTDRADAPATLGANVEVLVGRKGLAPQRNLGMELALAGGCDVIVFLDDDYVPSRRALELFCKVLTDHPDVVGVTGTVIADGIRGPGISAEVAEDLVRRHDEEARPLATTCVDTTGLYGCNMAYRASAIGGCRFDENLPLYAWQEDIDFSRQLLPRGRLTRTLAATGVHRGVKVARSPGFVLGWSQIVNPAYLVRKGTMPFTFAAWLVIRNLVANHLRALAPEPWVDRRGRVRGNWAGILELLRGRIDPSAVLNRISR